MLRPEPKHINSQLITTQDKHAVFGEEMLDQSPVEPSQQNDSPESSEAMQRVEQEKSVAQMSYRSKKIDTGLPSQLSDLEFDFENQKASNIDVLSTKKADRDRSLTEKVSLISKSQSGILSNTGSSLIAGSKYSDTDTVMQGQTGTDALTVMNEMIEEDESEIMAVDDQSQGTAMGLVEDNKSQNTQMNAGAANDMKSEGTFMGAMDSEANFSDMQSVTDFQKLDDAESTEMNVDNQ